MADSQSQPPADDDDFISFAPGLSREFALRRRWRKVARHTVLSQIFELLSQQPGRQMYVTEMARALGKDRSWIYQEIGHLVWTRIVDVERRDRRTYYKLRPGMAEQYQQWLASQQLSDES